MDVGRLLVFPAACLVAVLGLCAYGEEGAQSPAAPAKAAETPQPKIHACTGAGRWYPADADKLGEMLDAFLANQPPIPQAPVALIAPHAGYQYSGAVAGRAYAALKGRTYRRVILMGPSHQAPLRGASVLRVDAYDTPLGRIFVDIEARDALLKSSVVKEQPAAHANEHSVENQLPFLQRTIKDFKMVEVLVGDLSPSDRDALVAAVRPLVDQGTLMVVSSDFCHYGPAYGYVPFKDDVPRQLAALNAAATQEILQVDVAGWDNFLGETHDTICGRSPIGVLLKVLEPVDDVEGLRVGFDMSGHLMGDYTNSVTYASFVFWRAGEGLTPAEQETLLGIARESAVTFLKTGKAPEISAERRDLTPALRAPGAAFVTLKNGGRLRGCVGHIVAYKPLFASVVENACHACQDPRFTDEPITEKEAGDLSIEISVLTPMRRLADPQKVRVGKDGLMMAKGANRGLLLPQVPTEQGWTREQFLQGTCRKAGLPLDAWKDKDTEIYRFGAQVFGEEKPNQAGAK